MLSRREFLAAVAGVGMTHALPRLSSRAAPLTLRVGVIRFDASTDRGMGLVLGAEEAEHTARLLSGAVTLSLVALTPGASASAGLGAIIGDEDLCAPSPRGSALFLNVSCTADVLRDRCDPRLLHIAPSDAMIRDARALVGDPRAPVVAWHPSLTRFGADTLNQRFLKRFGRPMTAAAWTAWFAVKTLWETALRIRSVEPAGMRASLLADGSRFDGHKGRPLSFRSWDQQLRQPLYVVRGEELREVPATDDNDPVAGLDRLGTRSSGGTCPEI
jgi:hypothetical protein